MTFSKKKKKMFKVILQKHSEFVVFGILPKTFKLNLITEISERPLHTPYLGVAQKEGDWEGRFLAVVKPDSTVALSRGDRSMLCPSLCRQTLLQTQKHG